MQLGIIILHVRCSQPPEPTVRSTVLYSVEELSSAELSPSPEPTTYSTSPAHPGTVQYYTSRVVYTYIH